MSDGSVDNVDMPMQRIKRPHKKVRSGCVICKRARVKVSGMNLERKSEFLTMPKCDERQPRCTRCQRRKIECLYFDKSSTSSWLSHLRAEDAHRSFECVILESLPLPGVHGSPSISDLQPLGLVPDNELAKHYFTHTLQTFAEAGMSDTWRIFIPAVSIVCPVVRWGMLTLSAICLHHESSAENSGEYPSKYLEAAEAHGQIFVKESRKKLQHFQEGLNLQDLDSVLACSRLLCVLAFAFFRTHRQNGTTLADSAAWTWLHLLRGVKASYISVLEAGHPIDEVYIRDMIRLPHYQQPTPRMAVRYNDSCFCYLERSRRESIDALRSTLGRDWGSLGDHETENLRLAIDRLHYVMEQICSQKLQCPFATICVWPAAIPKGFVDMLVGGSALALAIYAHWLMLMVLMEDLWLVGDMGRAGIRDIIARCLNADRSVRRLLIWPQQMLDVGLPSPFCTDCA